MSASTPIAGSSSSPATFGVLVPPGSSLPQSPQKHEASQRRHSQSHAPQQPQPARQPSPSSHSRRSHSKSHSQSPATPTTGQRPSMAIHKGADAIMELLEAEKMQLTKLYHEAIRQIEASVKNAHAQDGIKLLAAERRLKTQDKTIELLNSKLRDAKARAAHSEKEMERLREEHEALKDALGQVGLVWTPAPAPASDVDEDEESGPDDTGTLEFTDRTKRIVNDFMRGARMQQKALRSSRLFQSLPASDLEDDRLSRPVTPTEFFDVLSGVMERGGKFAAELEKQRRRERARSEGTDSDRSSSRSQSQPTLKANAHDPRILQPTSLENTGPDLKVNSSNDFEMFTYQLNEFQKLTEHDRPQSFPTPDPPALIHAKRPASFPPSPHQPAKQQKMV